MNRNKTAAQIRREASDAQIIAARFPNMSKSTRDANTLIAREVVRLSELVAKRGMSAPALTIHLIGQVRGGKNAMGVTKSGRHYARPAFKKWRADMVAQINRQDAGGVLVSNPTNVRIDYVAGDRKRRDQTGIFDALFHLLEYAQVVTDDSLLWVVESSRSYDKAAPGVVIAFL